MDSLIEVNSQLLHQLHTHQMQAHPRLTMVTKLVFDSVTGWADMYNLYCTVLLDALEELEYHSAAIFPIVHVSQSTLLPNMKLILVSDRLSRTPF